MPVFKIHHITRYEYERPVVESVNEIRIFPYADQIQETLQHDLLISQQPNLYIFGDYWGNKSALFSIVAPHRELVIESKLIVRTTANSHLHLNYNTGLDTLPGEISSDLRLLELTKCENIAGQEEINNIIGQIVQPWKSISAIVQDCSQFIYQHYKYIKGITSVETTVDEILQHQAGVCQDFAHLMLHILRSLQIPCRYVSGYICPNKDGMRGEGATHAWVEVWIPQYGWAGIDPTNNVWVTNTHVKLAVGRNFKDCSPVKGTFKGPSRQHLSVFVSVAYEDGRSFEDLNNVTLYEQPDNLLTDIAMEGINAQQ
jgi:transglutaminase-like putative cysteine protease